MNLKNLLIAIKNKYQIEYYLRKIEHESEYLQRKFLTKTLIKAAHDVPFYRDILKYSTIDESNCFDVLKGLPIISKTELRDSKEHMATYVDSKWSSWHNTGGSTGTPLHFPTGGKKWLNLDLELFCQALLYIKMSGTFNVKISSFDGRRVKDTLLSQHIYWGNNPSNFPYGKIHYSTMYLNNTTFKYYFEKLNSEKPEIIRGYPSGIYEFAKLIKSNAGILSFKLKGIYLTSENIYDYQIATIKEVFKCPVWGQYGHSEASVFAIKDPESDNYICQAIYGVTEIVKDDGTHVKEGEMGEIVVTGFLYSAMPFIRYRTGDLAVYGGTVNGNVVIKNLVGRSNDYIVTCEGEKKFLVGFIFGGHLKAFNHIEQWQIIQNTIGKLHILIVKGNGYDEKVENELKNFFNSNGFELEIKYIGSIPKTIRGKQKFLIQNIAK